MVSLLCSNPRENWVDKTVEKYYYIIKEKQNDKVTERRD